MERTGQFSRYFPEHDGVKEKWGHFDEMMKHPTEVEKAVE